MKIKSLSMSNFAKYGEVSVSFDESVTYLVGANGAGKTGIGLSGIWAAMEGVAEKSKTALIADRYRLIGPNAATAKLQMILIDEVTKVEITVNRKLTKVGSELSFEAPEGMVLDQAWLTNLFNVFLISPQTFIDLSGKDQALALGIDTSTHDAKIKSLKEEFTLLSRDVKNLGQQDPVDKVEKVDVLKLTQEKQVILDFNKEQKDKQTKINQAEAILNGADTTDWQGNNQHQKGLYEQKTELEAEIEAIKLKIAALNVRIKQGEEYKKSLPKPEKEKPTTEIDQKINTAEETNTKAAKYVAYQEWLNKVAEANKKVIENKNKQEKAAEERLNYIKGKKLPFNNLSLDEDGALLLDGRPLKEQYFSSGQLLKVVPILMSTLNPELKYVFIQKFNLLDDANQKMIEKYLTEKGFQLVVELVSDKIIPGKNCILMKDCKVVTEDPSQDAGPSLAI